MHLRTMKTVLLVFLLVFSVLLLIGCSKVNQENYDKLQVGMDFSEVKLILGDADECNSAMGAKNCIWGDEQKHIEIKFVADKVMFFSGKGL